MRLLPTQIAVIVMPGILASSTVLLSTPFARIDAESVLAFPAPDALTMQDGQPVQNLDAWIHRRRTEILNLYAEYVYERTPAEKPFLQFHIDSVDPSALGGTAVRKQITICFSRDGTGPRIHLLLYLPKRAQTPVPVILG